MMRLTILAALVIFGSVAALVGFLSRKLNAIREENRDAHAGITARIDAIAARIDARTPPG